jgi:hypothetical protein
MQRTIALALLLAGGLAHAEDAPAAVTPFLDGEEGGVLTVRGTFGSVKDTLLIVIFDMKGAGSFRGFGLVPDAKAKHGHKKVSVAKLPAGTLGGEMKTALVANLDKDANDEVVLELAVQRSGGTHTFGSFEYVVLDWNGSGFVRVKALEGKLAKKMKSREAQHEALSDADVRAALGVK